MNLRDNTTSTAAGQSPGARIRTGWRNAIEPVSTAFEIARNAWALAPGWARWIVYALLIVGAILLPNQNIGSFMSPGTDWQSLLTDQIAIFVLLGIGLNVVVGQAGLLDLGYVAFYAMGGYSMAIFGTKYGWSFWEIIAVAILVSAASGLLLGAPTLRLRGDYLAIVTLGFGEIVRITARNSDYVNGPRGIQEIPKPPSLSDWDIQGVAPFKYGLLDARPYYYILLLFIVLAIIFVKRLENSRVGRAWMSIREDEDAAELMGVPTFRFKLGAFAIGAAIGGSGGVVFAAKTGSIIPDNFPFLLSATILAGVVLGGSGNLPGVMLGAFLVAWIPERLRGLQDFALFDWIPQKYSALQDYRILLFGAALVVMMALRPQGLVPSRRRSAEMREGEGGMGGLGAEAGGRTTTSAPVEVIK